MSETLNTAPREGWRNKHTDPMPTERCNMMVLHHEEGEIVGRWLPDEDDTINPLGRLYYVGKEYPHKRLCLIAWDGNNYEFTYYKVL